MLVFVLIGGDVELLGLLGAKKVVEHRSFKLGLGCRSCSLLQWDLLLFLMGQLFLIAATAITSLSFHRDHFGVLRG